MYDVLELILCFFVVSLPQYHENILYILSQILHIYIIFLSWDTSLFSFSLLNPQQNTTQTHKHKHTVLQMQEDIKRKNEEHVKEAEHEQFMAEKRRQLRAARIQRILAKEMPGGGNNDEQLSKSYDSDEGLFIWFDYALGEEELLNDCCLIVLF